MKKFRFFLRNNSKHSDSALSQLNMHTSPPPFLNKSLLHFIYRKCFTMFWSDWKINFPVIAIFIFSGIKDFVHNIQVLLINTEIKLSIPKDVQCSELDFYIHEFFFCTILSLWDMINFVFNSEIGTWEKSGRDFNEICRWR